MRIIYFVVIFVFTFVTAARLNSRIMPVFCNTQTCSKCDKFIAIGTFNDFLPC